jgi:hypothetical protein
MIYFFNVGHTLISVTKVPDTWTYQNGHNMLLNFPQCLSIRIRLLETIGSIAVITFYLLRPHKLTNKNQSQIQSV